MFAREYIDRPIDIVNVRRYTIKRSSLFIEEQNIAFTMKTAFLITHDSIYAL